MMGRQLDGKMAKRGWKLGLAWAGFLALALLVSGAQAAPVGRFVEVQGPVEVLKGGKLPAVPVQLNDGVEAGDVVRTKSTSRAQIQFADESTITIAPGSRVAVEEFLFDAAKGQRRAVLQVVMGLVKTVVNRLYRLDEPDFLIKTQTAVMGVRGTQWFTLVHYRGTDVFVKSVGDEAGPIKSQGLELGNILAGVGGKILLKALQHSRVEPGRGPGPITNLRLQTFERLEKLTQPPGGEDWDGLGLNLGKYIITYGPAGLPGALIPPAVLTDGGALENQEQQVRDTWGGLYVPPPLERRFKIIPDGEYTYPPGRVKTVPGAK